MMAKSTTTAMRAMKMPFLPRSLSMWLSRSVNLFSMGLTLPPTAWVSVGTGVVGFDMRCLLECLCGRAASAASPWS